MPDNAKYISPDMQNAMIRCISCTILETISKDISDASMFSIIIDSCSDIAGDNFSLSIRHFDVKTQSICERFICFEKLHYTALDAKSITNTIGSFHDNVHHTAKK